MTRYEVVVLAARRERGLLLGRRIEGLAATRLRAVVNDAATLEDALAPSRPELLVVDLAEDAERLLAALEGVPAPCPPLLVSSPPDDAALLLRAMRVGGREFLPHDASASVLQAAIERMRRSAPSTALEPGPGAPLLAVLGAKGGVGATFVATQLAVALCSNHEPTALLDLAQPVGDAGLQLDLVPPHCLARAAQETAALDATFLRTLLCAHPSGVQLLSATERAEDAELLRASTVERALALLRADFDWVVVDLGRGWNEGSVRALDFASHVLLVTQADLPALVNAKRQLDLLERLGIASEKVHVVANRDDRADAMPERDVKRFLGRSIELRLPDDAAVTRCANEGRTLGEAAPYGHAQRAMLELARNVSIWCGRSEPPAARAGLLERVRIGLWRKNYGSA